jgi:hypothetical protein
MRAAERYSESAGWKRVHGVRLVQGEVCCVLRVVSDWLFVSWW